MRARAGRRRTFFSSCRKGQVENWKGTKKEEVGGDRVYTHTRHASALLFHLPFIMDATCASACVWCGRGEGARGDSDGTPSPSPLHPSTPFLSFSFFSSHLARQFREADAHPGRVLHVLFAALLDALSQAERERYAIVRAGAVRKKRPPKKPHQPRASSLSLSSFCPFTFSSAGSRSLRRNVSTQSRKHRSTSELYMRRLWVRERGGRRAA